MQARIDPTGAAARYALMKQLPDRLARVRRRGRQLLHFGWDVNAAVLVSDDASRLADECAEAGERDCSEALAALSSTLKPLAVDQVALGDAGVEEFARLIERIDGLRESLGAGMPGAAANEMARHSADQVRSAHGITRQVTPPPEFVQRFAKPPPSRAGARVPVAPAVAPQETPAAAPAAPAAPERASVLPQRRPAPVRPEPVARPAPGVGRSAYYLTDRGELGVDLSRQLVELGYTVEHVEDADELKEVLQALAPNLVLVDAHFQSRVEDIGISLKAARTRASSRIYLVVLSDSSDVSQRLRAMRAGADSFLPSPRGAAEVVTRIHELFEAESADPFRVIIIEDDRSQALFAESILKKAGMATNVVLDPLKAIEAVEEFRPELILMDLYMPDCDGMELTTLIRERPDFANVPIVFLTGEHDSDKRFDALNAGGDDYLEKPIRPKYLISAVTNRVRRSRQVQRRAGETGPAREGATGLYTKTHLLERLAEALAFEDGTRTGGLLFVILDGGQGLRERAGLAAFDGLMSSVGKQVGGLIGGAELAARYGDSSFLLLTTSRGEHELLELGDQLRQAVSAKVFDVGDRSLALAASIGIAPFSHAWADANSMLNAAERACAQARSSPDHKVKLFEDTVTQTVSTESAGMVQELREALKQDSFQLMFQPVASLRGTSEEMFQVLLRLRGSDGKLYAASVLIPAAQQSGLINGVDRWVLSRCLMVIQERQRQERPLRLFVSQSSDALLDPNRVSWLAEQMVQRRISGDRLVLEFRHADILSRLRQVATFWEGLAPLGVKMCVSGFEATMSAYQALQHLPIEFLKVAPKYATGDGSSASQRQELRQIVTHAHERSIRVIAPQVEDAGSAAQLWSSGVDFIQGNFVQAATPELEFDFRASAI